MSIFYAALHLLGSKPLMVSEVAQAIVLGVALKTHDKAKLRQALVLLVALSLVLYSLSLRPPSPPDRTADILGSVASLLFFDPAVQALRGMMKPPKPSP